MVKLGVNIDHVATLRQARGGSAPSPLEAAKIVEQAGADGITIHLREDRRHIQDHDVYNIAKFISLPLNLEMACSKDVIDIALDVVPKYCCIVPEKRQELTTEGGLDVIGSFDKVAGTVQKLMSKGIKVSLFIEPDENQILAAKKTGAQFIEIHTGIYANAEPCDIHVELNKIVKSADFASEKGLIVNAGHGLNYNNTSPIAAIKNMHELNIGHSIIAKSIFTGLEKAVIDMKRIIDEAAL